MLLEKGSGKPENEKKRLIKLNKTMGVKIKQIKAALKATMGKPVAASRKLGIHTMPCMIVSKSRKAYRGSLQN